VKNLTISYLIAIHTLISVFVGILLVFVLFSNFQKLENAQHQVASSQIVAKDILRIEQGLKQYLILMDLVLGNEQTYLAAGSQRQAELLQVITHNISQNNLAKSLMDKLVHFSTIIKQSSDILPQIQAGSLPSATYLDVFDQQSNQAIETLASIQQEIDSIISLLTLNLEQQRVQNYNYSMIALVVFIIIIVVQWLWITMYLVKPIEKLNRAVTIANDSNAPFQFNNDIGPSEIQQLANNASLFINDLEAVINQRTELYRLEKNKAVAATEAKSKFLSSMSHELRTPLNAIIGFSQVLSLESLNDEQLDTVSMIYEAGENLHQLINSIFSFIQVEDGHTELSLTTVNFSTIAEMAIDSFQAAVANKNIELKLEIETASQALLIQADQRQLLTIYKTIISNAIKYSENESEIGIHLHVKNEAAVFSVIDHGLGISPEILNTIFVPFHQTQHGYFEGLSISLYMAKYYTDLMEGEILVESTFGEGSTFEVSFPIVLEN